MVLNMCRKFEKGWSKDVEVKVWTTYIAARSSAVGDHIIHSIYRWAQKNEEIETIKNQMVFRIQTGHRVLWLLAEKVYIS